MIRTSKPKTPDAIFTGDWHLTESTPICRTDNFWEAQWKKVDFIIDLAKDWECHIFNSGDLYDRWKVSPYLISTTLKHLSVKVLKSLMFVIYGNHDLPQHNYENAKFCGLYTLLEARAVSLCEGGSFGQELTLEKAYSLVSPSGVIRKIGMLHEFAYPAKAGLPWPGCTARTAEEILDAYPGFDVIVTGDNHTGFYIIDKDGRLLVNPGCITRQTADHINYKPSVYTYFADTNTVEAIMIPIEKGVVSKEHLTKVEERNSRIEAFISKLSDEWQVAISFEENLERFFEANRIEESVRQLIYKAMEGKVQ